MLPAFEIRFAYVFFCAERSLSDSSRKSVLIERYPPSKYATAFLGDTVVGAGGDLFISPPSNYSGSSLSDLPDHPYHSHHHSNHHHSSSSNHLARSLSMPGHESEGGHTSFTSCSVHGTLRSSFTYKLCFQHFRLNIDPDAESILWNRCL
jgi:hypothetical protein